MLEACVMSPRDGSQTTDRASISSFTGYLISPGKPVRMHGYTTSATAGAYTEIAATASQ